MTTLILSAMIALGQVGTVAFAGDANFADPSYGPDYLAMRLDRGTVVRICAAHCQTMTVTDYGPVVATGDIADIALVRFAHICGWSVPKARRMGECVVTVELVPPVALPATTTAAMWDQPWGWSR